MNDVKDITRIALEAGTIVLESSGETYRVEETMRIFARALGANKAEAYATPTCIVSSCTVELKNKKNEVCTLMKRVSERNTNLGRLTAVNDLSRFLASSSQNNIKIEKVERRLGEIEALPLYSPLPTVIGTAGSAAAFAPLFSGTIKDALICFVIGAFMRIVLYFIKPLKLPAFITTIIGSAVISFISGYLTFHGVNMHFDIINISALMPLVPGTAIVLAIRDIISGDYISGSARSLEAFTVALSISLGMAAGLLIFPSALDYNTSMSILPDEKIAFIFAALASLSFALMFQVKGKAKIFSISIAGGIGWLLYIVLLKRGVNSVTANMLGAMCVGLLSEICAVIFHSPATVFTIPSLIPFVPGAGMYTIMYNITLGKQQAALSSFISTLSVAGALAIGVALAGVTARLYQSSKRKILSHLAKLKRG